MKHEIYLEGNPKQTFFHIYKLKKHVCGQILGKKECISRKILLERYSHCTFIHIIVIDHLCLGNRNAIERFSPNIHAMFCIPLETYSLYSDYWQNNSRYSDIFATVQTLADCDMSYSR